VPADSGHLSRLPGTEEVRAGRFDVERLDGGGQTATRAWRIFASKEPIGGRIQVDYMIEVIGLHDDTGGQLGRLQDRGHGG